MSFDFKTQKINKKGQVVQRAPYRMHIVNGVQKIERPPGSGIFYSADGSLIEDKAAEKLKKQSKEISALSLKKELTSLKEDLSKEIE